MKKKRIDAYNKRYNWGAVKKMITAKKCPLCKFKIDGEIKVYEGMPLMNPVLVAHIEQTHGGAVVAEVVMYAMGYLIYKQKENAKAFYEINRKLYKKAKNL